MRGPQVDDLHPDSDDANVVKIPSDNNASGDDTVDASDSPATDDAARAAVTASKEDVANDNGATDQPAANKVDKVDEADSAPEADDAGAATQPPPSDGARSADAVETPEAPETPDEEAADAV